MEKIIVNQDNLKESDITEVVKRVKILLINSKNEILLGYSYNEYQFPGGHVDEDEQLIDALNRELEEEIGVKLNLNIEPFACAYEYYKNWPTLGSNTKLEIYYYELRMDIDPNLEQTNYTDYEKEGNYILKFIPMEILENELIENVRIYGDNNGITTEMLTLLEIYKKKHE